ncbi:MAG: response regulator [Spirochaetia bacterium]|nr:response regulator [Spirochaetia bacterium]
MKLLLYEPINQVQVLMVNTLIQNGVMVFAITDKYEIISKLHTKQFPVLICDASPDDNDIIGIVQEIKKDEIIAATKIILHVKNPSKDFLVDMVKIGVSGFVLKPFVPATFIPKFNDILKKIDPGMTERKHIRVAPDPKDNASVTLRSAGSFKLITGRIKDVSMGGVLFQTTTALEENDVVLKQISKSIQIKFRLNTIEVSAMVIAKQQNMVALKFVTLSDFDKNVLSKYIYEILANDHLSKK